MLRACDNSQSQNMHLFTNNRTFTCTKIEHVSCYSTRHQLAPLCHADPVKLTCEKYVNSLQSKQVKVPFCLLRVTCHTNLHTCILFRLAQIQHSDVVLCMRAEHALRRTTHTHKCQQLVTQAHCTQYWFTHSQVCPCIS